MKKLTLLIFVLLISNLRIVNAQIPIKDAFTLAKCIKSTTGKFDIDSIDKVGFVLSHYLTNQDQTIPNEFCKNYFINCFFANIDINKRSGSPLSFSTISSSVGGLDVTTIADGFAKFIVKRTKQELSIAFFEKFKENLNNYPDLKTLFPNTLNLLNAIDKNIYDYNNYINSLREAFRSDIQELSENLPGIINNHQEFFKQKNNFKYGIALKSACYIVASLKHDMHPGDILDNYPIGVILADAPVEDTTDLKKLKGAIQTLQLFSESLKETDTSKHNYWVGTDKIRQLVNNKTTLQIYLGLVLQVAHNKYGDIYFDDKNSLYGVLNQSKVVDQFNMDYYSYKEYIFNLSNKANELNKMIKDYSVPANDSLKTEQYTKYFKSSVQFIEYCTQVSKLPHICDLSEMQNLGKKLQLYFDVAYQTTDLATALNRKRYPEAICHLLAIYNEVINHPDQGTPAEKNKLSRQEKDKIIESLLKADPQATVSSVLNSYKVNDSAGKVLNALAKYGTFMANMINAKSSDEVEKTIESAALPTGSSRIKRETSFNVSLNAYCGLFAGQDRININTSAPDYSYGITAPIGIAASWGRKHSSFSIFVSVFDIGAITAFRFTNDTLITLPKIQLRDIISPGLFFSYGIPKTPLSINFGFQLSPALARVGSTENDINASMFRTTLGFCVDLPILNLYSKSK